jgi:hypothetical protein
MRIGVTSSPELTTAPTPWDLGSASQLHPSANWRSGSAPVLRADATGSVKVSPRLSPRPLAPEEIPMALPNTEAQCSNRRVYHEPF